MIHRGALLLSVLLTRGLVAVLAQPTLMPEVKSSERICCGMKDAKPAVARAPPAATAPWLVTAAMAGPLAALDTVSMAACCAAACGGIALQGQLGEVDLDGAMEE